MNSPLSIESAGPSIDLAKARDSSRVMEKPSYTFMLALGVLLLSAMPDGMIVPVLKEIVADRYGVSDGAALNFMWVNLAGGILSLPLLSILRRRFRPSQIIACSLLADAGLLLVMMLPLGYYPTLFIRGIEGGTDLLAFAVIFDLLGKAGQPEHRGRRLGISSSVLLFALGFGMYLGGWVGSHRPSQIFVAGALANGAALLCALSAFRSFDVLVASCPAVDVLGSLGMGTKRIIWPALLMSFSDRTIAGLSVTALPIYLNVACGYDPADRGKLLAPMIGFMALGAFPAGWLADRVGAARLRAFCALGYAACFLGLPLAAQQSSSAALAVASFIGVFGAALLPTSLMVATMSGRGSIGMALHRTAGDLGYLTGILAGTIALTLTADGFEEANIVIWLIAAFAVCHLSMTLAASAGIAVGRISDRLASPA